MAVVPAHVTLAVWPLAAAQPPDRALLDRTLPAPEQDAARAMTAPEARSHHLWGRVLLRVMLAQLGGRDPRDVVLRVDSHGALKVDGWWVNLTHTAGLVACAVSPDAPVGVDTERWDRPVSVAAIASQALTDGERDALALLGGDAQRRALLRTWTVKEAYAKAMGLGLALSVRRFSVALEGRGPARLVLPQGVPGAEHAWSVEERDHQGTHALALCVRAAHTRVETLDVAGWM